GPLRRGFACGGEFVAQGDEFTSVGREFGVGLGESRGQRGAGIAAFGELRPGGGERRTHLAQLLVGGGEFAARGIEGGAGFVQLGRAGTRGVELLPQLRLFAREVGDACRGGFEFRVGFVERAAAQRGRVLQGLVLRAERGGFG